MFICAFNLKHYSTSVKKLQLKLPCISAACLKCQFASACLFVGFCHLTKMLVKLAVIV